MVGCYQIGKEKAAQAVAEACRSPIYVETRRWKVIQLAGWGDATPPGQRTLEMADLACVKRGWTCF